MKKILILLIILSLSSSAHAILGIGSLTEAVKSLLGKTENINNTTENIQSQQKEIHAGITDLVKINNDMNFRLGNIETKVSPQVVAGIGNRTEQRNTEMRDDNSHKNKNVVNSTELLTYIFGGLFSFMTFICGRLVLTIRQMNKQITDLIDRNSAKELKIFEMNDKHTKDLLDMVKGELND